MLSWSILTVNRIEALRRKLKESQKHTQELDKHLYELPRCYSFLYLFRPRHLLTRSREEMLSSQGGEKN